MGRDVEDDSVGGNLFGNDFQQGLRLGPTDPVGNQRGRALSENSPVLQCEPEHLREARLTRPEKSRYPHTDLLVGDLDSFPVLFQDFLELPPHPVGDDVLRDLLIDDRLVGLFDLDDLFNRAGDVPGEERFHVSHGSHLRSSEYFWSIIVFGIQDPHEPQTRRAFHLTGIEKHPWDGDFSH